MTNLIKPQNNITVATSVVLARKLKRKHSDLLKDIQQLECSDKFRQENFHPSIYSTPSGTEKPMYLVTRSGFMLLSMSLSGGLAAEYKERCIALFNEMERKLTGQTSRARHDVSAMRNAVSRFVEYATNQGSKNASRYYSNLTRMECAALDLISQRETVPSNFRDTLDALDLAFLTTAEYIAKSAIDLGMSHGMAYQDIYSLAKQKVMAFADTVRITRIGEKRLNHPDLPTAKD